MDTYRETIYDIGPNYALWKKIIEAEYTLIGLADDIFDFPVRYYFNNKGIGIISAKDRIIVLGDNKSKVSKEIIRLRKMIENLS